MDSIPANRKMVFQETALNASWMVRPPLTTTMQAPSSRQWAEKASRKPW
jgi:hypothetical protein